MRRAVPIVILVACATHVVPVVAPTAVDTGPHPSARAWVLRAHLAEHRGDLEEATDAWAWARRYDPDAAAAHGAFLLRMGAFGPAGSAFRDALTRDPLDTDALLGLATLEARDGLPAPEHIDPVVEASPCRALFVPGPHQDRALALCRAR
ncbi:MAG: hypothetical protein H6736_08035 [Alphaproteobacteria bacterium]|nr:hypothetical protein [Alphaproteobacteria bacterium]MCB9691748.1 hypothetical protein [Alphaproteobacteria bacterium]